MEHRFAHSVALRLAQWDVADGEHWGVRGESGSGKTTLLHILAGLLQPSAGEVVVAERVLAGLTSNALDTFRGRTIGIVPQALHLIGSLRVAENLALAQRFGAGVEDRTRIHATLAQLGLDECARRFPRELSQGQKQRVAIARAVINRPRLLLADEPTANLDDANARRALELLRAAARDCNATLIVATHDRRVHEELPHTLTLERAQ